MYGGHLRIALLKPTRLPVLVRHFASHPMKRKRSPASAETMTTVQLDPRERQLKSLLLDAAAYIDRTRASSEAEPASPQQQQQTDEQLVLRWAGGWVRDKLLGRPSHDIDVAINCMTGEVFGNQLRVFCDNPANKDKHSLRKEDIGNLHKIAKNPDKSKNLETATVKIFGLDIDFVNLRTETYAEDSRNPEMDFGTPEEDASRRDATVNALFYNLHTDEVEDFVGGLADMERKIIRTPLEPFQTFMDDPLRVLRLVRFASRLQFTIEDNVKEFMGDERVLNALRLKISRERVGVEVEKMLKGEYPRDAVRYIHDLGLYYTVFTDPSNEDMARPDLTGWREAYNFLDCLATYPLYDVLVTSDEERYLAWILACIVPFSRVPFDAANYRKNPPAAMLAAREGVKAPNRITEVVTAAVLHREEIVELKNIAVQGLEHANERDYFGMRIRAWDAREKLWRSQVLFAMLDDIMQRVQTAGPGNNGTSKEAASRSPAAEQSVSAAIDAVQQDWQMFVDHLKRLDLLDAPSIKPLVDGRLLSKELGIKPGKWMSSALDVCMAWQLRNPQETDPAAGIEEVRQRKEELGIAGLL